MGNFYMARNAKTLSPRSEALGVALAVFLADHCKNSTIKPPIEPWRFGLRSYF